MKSITIKDFKKGEGYSSYNIREDKNILALKDEDIIINLAYTDYGGTFFDKVAIEYFKKYYPNNIIYESTNWNGQNAVLYGNIVHEFLKEYENYILGFENIEEFYSSMEWELYQNDFEYFLKDIQGKYLFNFDDVLDYLMENKQGYYNIYPNMIDFNLEDLIEELLKENLIFNEDESLLYAFINNGIEENIARYYIQNYENGTLKDLILSESILSIFKDYENNLK